MQYSPVCGHTGSQCFDEGDRGNWANRWFHGTRVGTRVGHTGPGYPSTQILTSLVPVRQIIMPRWTRMVFLSARLTLSASGYACKPAYSDQTSEPDPKPGNMEGCGTKGIRRKNTLGAYGCIYSCSRLCGCCTHGRGHTHRRDQQLTKRFIKYGIM